MRKVFTASRILALWSSTCVSRAPAGSVRRTCSAAARIALPKPSPSALGRIDTARMTADRPSWRTTASGGSAKPRATIANVVHLAVQPDGRLHRGLYAARRGNRLTLRQCLGQATGRQAHAGEPPRIDIDEQPLRQFADDLGLARSGYAQHRIARLLRQPDQPGIVRAGQGKDVTIDVGIVLTRRQRRAGRQRGLDVLQLVPDLLPDILDLSGRGGVLQLDGDDAGSVEAIGLEIVEIVDPAQRALDRIGDLRLHLRRARAVPAGGHDHFLQREAGIFVAPQRQELRRARDEEQRDQETHQGGVPDRPAG
ncbi:hypothetical protein WR25_23971 [Diploscapter pachys]|uniref:Uncharacterized protein n=1 Tax=Diploscapter pachys TaxID=2018661 RepID=A0A2A2M1K6_9BILA|nr:hypothetical protein WR25_23971 [Diploscapter pachys]